MFAQNLSVWGPQAVTDGIVGDREVAELVEDLEVVAGGGRAASIT